MYILKEANLVITLEADFVISPGWLICHNLAGFVTRLIFFCDSFNAAFEHLSENLTQFYLIYSRIFSPFDEMVS